MFETQRILNDFSYCERLMNDFHKPLIESGIVPDVIGAKKELSEYRLIFAPYMMTLEDGGLQGRLEKWVRNGGVLVAGPMCDIRNALGAHYRDADTGMLEKLTGCTLDYSIPDSSVYIKSQWTDGTPFTGKMWHELYTSCDGAQELVSVTGGHSAVVGKAVVTKVKLGKGEIILLGSIPSEDDIKKLIGIAAADAGVIPFDISGSVIAVPRKGENYEGLILAEYKNQGGTCILPRAMTDVLTGDALSGKITLTPYEIRILQI
ncbi:MAG: beta-galactosidase trimerization domain-containing protein [Clostridia bacterium]|nr:beta-galactosidase trimerization domain-containing protein [Clostridia bacterium]